MFLSPGPCPTGVVGDHGARRKGSDGPQGSHDRFVGRRSATDIEIDQTKRRCLWTRNRQDKLTALRHHLNVDVLRWSFLALKKRATPAVDEIGWEHEQDGLHSKAHSGSPIE
jgi:RNA-directed DNA polymerase